MRPLILTIIMFFAFTAGVKAMEEKPGSAVTLKTKGDACYEAGRYSDALEYYTSGMSRAKDEGNDAIYYACIGNIGNIYGRMADFKRALHYYMKGYEASKRNRANDMQWGFVTNIVAVYSLLGDATNAKAFFNLQTSIPIKDQTMRRFYFLSNQAMVAQAGKNLQMAEYYYKAALSYANERDMAVMYKISTLSSIGNILSQKGESAGALRFFTEARDSAAVARDREQLVGIYKSLSETYKKIGQGDSAKKYHEMNLALSDSIFNLSQYNMANSKLFEYENAENTKLINSLVSRNYIQLAVIAVFLILAVALTLLYLTLRRRNRSLLEAQRLLVSKNEDLMASNAKSRKLLEEYVKMTEGAPSSSPRGGEPGVTLVDQQGSSQSSTTEENITESVNQQGKSQSSPTGGVRGGSEEVKAGAASSSGSLSLLDDVQKNKLLNAIITVMENAEVISKSDFNLNALAEKVNSNTKYVSWVINDTFGKNFRTLLNEYRINEACKRLADKEHYGNMTIQAISEEVGFNSAASFIQAFKRTNGMTPSMYQRLRKT